jgi:DNA-binding NarL/FixJ family response regulator
VGGRPRVLIADDHTLIAEAFAKLLEPDFEVVGNATDGRALLQLAPNLKPDVVLLDLGMPFLNGLDAGRRLKQVLPNTKIVVLTMSEDAMVAAEALQSWASGFLLKKSVATELVNAIREVLKGKRYVTTQLANQLVEEFVRNPQPVRRKSLTPRQREVLQLLAEGRSMKEAADILHITSRTVAFHKYRIMEEFGIKNNADLVRFATKEKIVGQA